MALSITGFTGPQGSGQSKGLGLDSRLSINSPVPSSSPTDIAQSISSLTAEQLAQRDATLKLSQGASSINTKEYFTVEQIGTIDSLISKALAIKSEVDPTRVTSIANDATSLITANATQYAAAVADDSNLSQTETVFAIVSSDVPTGSSDGKFSTTIAPVQSLASLGVSSSLSFSKGSIDATITTLQAARDGLTSSLDSFSSSRTAISAEVQAQGTNAQLASDAGSTSVEDIAKSVANQISQSTDSLLAHSQVDKLNVAALLETTTPDTKSA
ncbi:MAG: hypothetical protein U0136_01550 [Bdellovibrionota bacterium]